MSDLHNTALRNLRIKSGVVKRLSKEHNLYKKEAEEQQRKLDKLTAENIEEWDIKNATRMMEEANRMITDSADRLGKASGELRDLIIEGKKNTSLAESEEMQTAGKILESVST